MTQAQSKSDALYARVRGDILTLVLRPDAPLRLPALTERYGIGLTPLRECLNRLASEHLVVPEHNKGFRVAALSRADLLDLERSRNAVVGAMFVEAVLGGDDAWEAGVIGTYHHLSQTPVPSAVLPAAELAAWTRRHGAFHAALVAASPSVWMARFAVQIEDQLGRYHRFIEDGLRELATTNPDVAQQAAAIFATAMAVEPHRALYDAVLARDPVAAQAAFDAHAGLSIAAFEGLMKMMPMDTAVAVTLGGQTEVAK